MTHTTDVALLCWRDTGHPQGGGSETYLERVGAELARRGVGVTYLTAAYPGAAAEEIRDGIRFIRVGGRISVYPRVLGLLLAARWVRGPLAGRRPDVVVDTQNGVPFFACLTRTAPTVVLVHHCHREQWPVAGRALGWLGWRIESRLSPRIHRRARYVTVSDPSRRELIDLGVDDERIAVVHNGLDPLPATMRASVRADADAPGVPRLCVLSRLVPHKQVEHALTALAELRGSGVEVELDIIGDGWWSNQLRSAAVELGIDNAVTFHGHVDERTKHEILGRARAHLMPSRKEGWGLAVMEAAQHGVPTIGYRSSVGLVESIDDHDTGLLVDSLGEFISAARKLVDNPDEAARLGSGAERKSHNYSWSTTCDEMLSVIDGLRS